VLDVDKVQNDFLNTLRQKEKISLIMNVNEQLHTLDNKDLLIFHVPEAAKTDKPVFLNGDIRRSFLRKGACDVRCSPEELQRLLSDASEKRYDGRILDYDLNECFVDKDIDWYRRNYEKIPSNRNYTELDDMDFLFQLGHRLNILGKIYWRKFLSENSQWRLRSRVRFNSTINFKLHRIIPKVFFIERRFLWQPGIFAWRI
jgi:predicted HTH transcriptional regulator